MKYKHTMLPLFGVLCLVIVVFLSLSSCGYSKYRGEQVDLYTVAVNNIFGVSGYISNGEVSYDPGITVIETDPYGRVLFFYNENYGHDDFLWLL